MNIDDALKQAGDILISRGIADARREAGSLLGFAIGRDRTFLIAHPEYELKADELGRYESYVERRGRREPFQYIVGRQEFFGLDFTVTPDVLIPRPETEILVEKAIEILEKKEHQTFCEIGIGSGCISVSILYSLAKATARATDVSDKAIAVARDNAVRHGVADRIELYRTDTFTGITGRFQLIVSNPPYVPDQDLRALQPEVGKFEPEVALAGGTDGLDIISNIIRVSPAYLEPQGVLLMEIGFDQSERVRELFDTSLWSTPEFVADLQGIQRIVVANLLN